MNRLLGKLAAGGSAPGEPAKGERAFFGKLHARRDADGRREKGSTRCAGAEEALLPAASTVAAPPSAGGAMSHFPDRGLPEGRGRGSLPERRCTSRRHCLLTLTTQQRNSREIQKRGIICAK